MEDSVPRTLAPHCPRAVEAAGHPVPEQRSSPALLLLGCGTGRAPQSWLLIPFKEWFPLFILTPYCFHPHLAAEETWGNTRTQGCLEMLHLMGEPPGPAKRKFQREIHGTRPGWGREGGWATSPADPFISPVFRVFFWELSVVFHTHFYLLAPILNHYLTHILHHSTRNKRVNFLTDSALNW